MKKVITPKNILYVGIFIATLLPNLYTSYKGNTYDDIRLHLFVCSCIFGVVYVGLRQDYEDLPETRWVFFLFAAFSWINSYALKVTAQSDFFDPRLLGGSLGSSLPFTIVFGVWFSIGYRVNLYRRNKANEENTKDKENISENNPNPS